MHPTLTRVLLLLSLAALLFVSCANPLWPRYIIEKQRLDLDYSAAPSPRLSLRVAYRLKNTGDRDISLLDLRLPPAAEYGLTNLRILVDNREASPLPASTRIPLSPPWPRKAKLDLVVSYHLTASHPPALSLLDGSFFLSTSPWYPVLQSPEAFLGAGGEPPDKYDLYIRVPGDFLVHAPGKPKGSKARGHLREFRFEIVRNDFPPFVIAGRFSEQRYSASSIPILFWTRQPLPPGVVQQAGSRLAQSAAVFEDLFGPRFHTSSPFRIVNPPPDLVSSQPLDRLPSFTALPDSVVFFPNAPQQAPTLFMASPADTMEAALASTWLDLLSRPMGQQESRLSAALSVYAALLAREAGGEKHALADSVNAAIVRYEATLARLETASTSSTPPTFPVAARGHSTDDVALSTSHAFLFLKALEDQVGPTHFRAALRRMIQARRRRDWSLDDFRSALEYASGQNLGPFFRQWLNEPGIPPGFLARYSSPP